MAACFNNKGLDFIDREKAKRHARDQCQEVIVNEYNEY